MISLHVIHKTLNLRYNFFMKKEKERKNWRENLVTSLEVPGDLAMKETIITLTGRNHAVVCNYKSILRYQQEEIVVLGFHGKVVIRGKRLMIPKYTSEEMQNLDLALRHALEQSIAFVREKGNPLDPDTVAALDDARAACTR